MSPACHLVSSRGTTACLWILCQFIVASSGHVHVFQHPRDWVLDDNSCVGGVLFEYRVYFFRFEF
jgi:hypothetical protein